MIGLQTSYEKLVNKLLKYARERVKDSLHFQAINITIAGDPDDLEQFSEFKKLVKEAKQAKVNLLIGVMGSAGNINCGPGAIGLGIAPKNLAEEP